MSLLVLGCGTGEGPQDNGSDADGGAKVDAPAADANVDAAIDASVTANSGTLRVLTYNVAGLPVGVSGSNPSANTPLMSPLLNAYDLVLAQEDFTYHDALAADATHPHRSTPMTPVGVVPVADGLNRFSMIPFSDHARVQWDECNGTVTNANDCLAPKGFSFARHTLAPGATIDVYNLHADAGRGDGDRDARDDQVAQIVEYIGSNSAGKAVLVAGDTNMKAGDEATLQALLTGAGLEDSCTAVACLQPEVYDRLLFRSSDTVTISVADWWDDPLFEDSFGLPLSDHPAIGIDLAWTVD